MASLELVQGFLSTTNLSLYSFALLMSSLAITLVSQLIKIEQQEQ